MKAYKEKAWHIKVVTNRFLRLELYPNLRLFIRGNMAVRRPRNVIKHLKKKTT